MLRLLCCLCCLLPLALATAADGDGDAGKPQQIEAVHLGVIPDPSPFDDTRGVRVKRVEPGNCAEEMGIRPGDIITHFNSQPVIRVTDLKRALAASRIGNEATVTVKRGSQVLDLSGTLRAKFRAGSVEEKRRTLDKLTKASVKSGKAKAGDLARNLKYLAVALNELPDRIEDAAHEFKKVYPKGEFTVNIEIRISTNKDDEPATSIKLGEEGRVPKLLEEVDIEEDEPAEAETEDEGEPADDQGTEAEPETEAPEAAETP